MTKYSVPDGHWEEDDTDEPDPDRPTSIDAHTVDVILTTDSTEDMGYGREKYTAHITHDDEDGPCVLYFTEHRWKGNFWRDIHDLDWQDVSQLVKQEVARVVDCDSVDDLDPEVRLVDEGGVRTWRRHNEETER